METNTTTLIIIIVSNIYIDDVNIQYDDSHWIIILVNLIHMVSMINCSILALHIIFRSGIA
jgi:hypothetical protein